MKPAALLLCLAIALASCGESDSGGSGSAERAVILATTTSTQDSELLDVLVPAFERESGRQVKTVAVGSGEAIELGRRGEADVLLVHSPDDEERLMASGKAGERRLVMHNDFVFVGPPDDPAGIRGTRSTAALVRIAREEAPFASRGDDSGTHLLELELWGAAGIDPSGSWYQETGQGMGATLRIADQKRAYTISDRGTHLSTADSTDLDVLVGGEPRLLNVYHVIDIRSSAGPRVNVAGGRAFAEWIVSSPAQRMIGSFGRREFGRPLFVPDAGETEREVRASA
ncbi:MAG TPA: substrate-binding domain-containing protein [Thermoleophilaceae bacterium]|nr:substrate-binding domain-containing protein [Thermoleophilaceae bacterium]